MLIRELGVLALFVWPSAMLANECTFIADNDERLACFDALFAESEQSEAPPVERSVSEWVSRTATSDMTDQTNVFLTVFSVEPLNCRWARGERAILTLRCLEDTTSVIFSTGCHMTSSRYNNYGDVTYRLDNESPQVRGFHESTNNRALGLWRGRDAIPFIRNMIGHDRLLARMTPYGENAIEMEFNISGLENEIGALQRACGWN